ncbi:MAG: putative tricarboxylic transport rane protein [Burkholderiales bacterium]|jgi:putative tricarboxylic transport membrane protein
MRKLTWALAFGLAMGAATASVAQQGEANYPKRPVNVLIGYAPGGGSDVMLSMIRPLLEKKLKTTMVPVYKPGAGSDIALAELAQSKPDGYTVVITTTPQLPINPVVRQTQYKVSDLVFVANVVTDPGILVVRAESPYKTLADFIKGAKDNPGKVGVGVSSAPGDDWFAAQMMQEIGKVKLNVVPFAGDGPSWQAALGGHVDSSANNLSIVYSQVKGGKLRALAIMSEKRSPFLPDVPTFKELGYDITSGSARGFAMPKNTPKAIVDTFANAVKEVMDSGEFKSNAEKTAFPSEFMNPEQHAAFIKKLDGIYRPLWEKYGQTATAAK